MKGKSTRIQCNSKNRHFIHRKILLFKKTAKINPNSSKNTKKRFTYPTTYTEFEKLVGRERGKVNN